MALAEPRRTSPHSQSLFASRQGVAPHPTRDRALELLDRSWAPFSGPGAASRLCRSSQPLLSVAAWGWALRAAFLRSRGSSASCPKPCVRRWSAGRKEPVDSLALPEPRTPGAGSLPWELCSRRWAGCQQEWCCWEAGNVLPFPLFSEILLKEVAV